MHKNWIKGFFSLFQHAFSNEKKNSILSSDFSVRFFARRRLLEDGTNFFFVSSVEGGEWRWFSVYSFAPSRSLDVIWIVILIIVILLVGLLITLQQLLHFMIPKLLIVFHLRRNEWRACCGIREGMRKSGSVSKSIWVSRHKKKAKKPFSRCRTRSPYSYSPWRHHLRFRSWADLHKDRNLNKTTANVR